MPAAPVSAATHFVALHVYYDASNGLAPCVYDTSAVDDDDILAARSESFAQRLTDGADARRLRGPARKRHTDVRARLRGCARSPPRS